MLAIFRFRKNSGNENRVLFSDGRVKFTNLFINPIDIIHVLIVEMIGALSLAGALLTTTSRSATLLLQQNLVGKAGIVAGLLSRSREKQQPENTLIFPTLTNIWDAVLLWAVPKKRTSHSKKRMRMAHKYLRPKHHYQMCQKCGQLKLQHMLCGHCFRETMRLTAEVRRQRAGQLTQAISEQRQPQTQLHAHALEDGSR